MNYLGKVGRMVSMSTSSSSSARMSGFSSKVLRRRQFPVTLTVIKQVDDTVVNDVTIGITYLALVDVTKIFFAKPATTPWNPAQTAIPAKASRINNLTVMTRSKVSILSPRIRWIFIPFRCRVLNASALRLSGLIIVGWTIQTASGRLKDVVGW